MKFNFDIACLIICSMLSSDVHAIYGRFLKVIPKSEVKMPRVQGFGDCHMDDYDLAPVQNNDLIVTSHIWQMMGKDLCAITEDYFDHSLLFKYYDKNNLIITQDKSMAKKQTLHDLTKKLYDAGISVVDAECRHCLTQEESLLGSPTFMQALQNGETLAGFIYDEAVMVLKASSIPAGYQRRIKKYLNDIVSYIKISNTIMRDLIESDDAYKGATYNQLFDLNYKDKFGEIIKAHLQKTTIPQEIKKKLQTQVNSLFCDVYHFRNLFDLSMFKRVIEQWNRTDLIVCAGNAHINSLKNFLTETLNYKVVCDKGHISRISIQEQSTDLYVSKLVYFYRDLNEDYGKPRKLKASEGEAKLSALCKNKSYKTYRKEEIYSTKPDKIEYYHIKPILVASELLLSNPWSRWSWQRSCAVACMAFRCLYKPENISVLMGDAVKESKTGSAEGNTNSL
jgi:hypothetical protein